MLWSPLLIFIYSLIIFLYSYNLIGLMERMDTSDHAGAKRAHGHCSTGDSPPRKRHIPEAIVQQSAANPVLNAALQAVAIRL